MEANSKLETSEKRVNEVGALVFYTNSLKGGKKEEGTEGEGDVYLLCCQYAGFTGKEEIKERKKENGLQVSSFTQGPKTRK